MPGHSARLLLISLHVRDSNNVLSHMLNQAALEDKFGNHPKCVKVQLTHLSFADDILVSTDGSEHSLDGVLEVMDRFTELSGLHINASKSSIWQQVQVATIYSRLQWEEG